MLAYPITWAPDGSYLLGACRDLPEANPVGATPEDLLLDAVDSLETVIIARMEDREDVPLPSPAEPGEQLVRLPALTTAKILLYRAMREQDISKAELSRRLALGPTQIQRLLRIGHASRLDHLDAALAAVGRRLMIDAPAA